MQMLTWVDVISELDSRILQFIKLESLKDMRFSKWGCILSDNWATHIYTIALKTNHFVCECYNCEGFSPTYICGGLFICQLCLSDLRTHFQKHDKIKNAKE